MYQTRFCKLLEFSCLELQRKREAASTYWKAGMEMQAPITTLSKPCINGPSEATMQHATLIGLFFTACHGVMLLRVARAVFSTNTTSFSFRSSIVPDILS